MSRAAHVDWWMSEWILDPCPCEVVHPHTGCGSDPFSGVRMRGLFLVFLLFPAGLVLRRPPRLTLCWERHGQWHCKITRASYVSASWSSAWFYKTVIPVHNPSAENCRRFCFLFAQSCLTLRPHGLQHARPPCPSPTCRACSNSCPLSRWWHPTISSSVVPFFSHLQSFPASGSFAMSQLFATGGLSIRVSASASVLPMKSQDWFPLGWTGWIFLQSKGLSRVFSNTTVQKHQFFGAQLYLQSNSHIHTLGITIALTRPTFLGKVMSLPFNMLSRLVIAFLPRSKHLLISWLQSPSAGNLEPKKIKSDTVSRWFASSFCFCCCCWSLFVLYLLLLVGG